MCTLNGVELSGIQIAQRVKGQLSELTGLQADTVSGLYRIDNCPRQLNELTGPETDIVSGLPRIDNGWRIDVVMVEMKCVPDSNDLLGCYDVTTDDEGTILQYKRTSRYRRQTIMDRED
jgi:hypothetical protein